jgi:hypothetical protein
MASRKEYHHLFYPDVAKKQRKEKKRSADELETWAQRDPARGFNKSNELKVRPRTSDSELRRRSRG